MQCSESLPVQFRIGLRSQGLLQQNNIRIHQGAEHPSGLIDGPTAIGINLQLDGIPKILAALCNPFRHGPKQQAVVIEPIGAAQLQLHPRGRQLLPPTLQPIQHSGDRPEPQGHAGGNRCVSIQAPEPPERLPQLLTPPVPQRQIHSASRRRAHPIEHRLKTLGDHRIQAFQVGQQSDEFLLHPSGGVGPVARVQTTGFAPTDAAICREAQLQPVTAAVVPRLMASGTALVRETAGGSAHTNATPIPKLTPPRCLTLET